MSLTHHDAMSSSFDLHYAARTSIDQRSATVIEQIARIAKQLNIGVNAPSPLTFDDPSAAEGLFSSNKIRGSKVSPGRTLRSSVAAEDRDSSPLYSQHMRLSTSETSLLRHKEDIALLESQLDHLRAASQDKDEQLAQAKIQLQQVQEATSAFFGQPGPSVKSVLRRAPSASSPTRSPERSTAPTPLSILEQGKEYLRHEETIRQLENSILETQTNLDRLSQQLAVDDTEYVQLEKRKTKALADLATANAASGNLDERLSSLEAQAAQCQSQRLALQQELDVLCGNASDAASLAPLEKRKKELETRALEAEEEILQLREADANLQQSIANGGGFTLQFANLSMEVSTSMRRLHRVRECMMLLKAFLINLCDDLDTIAETVQVIKDDPNFTAFSPFTEQSNSWRRHLLSAAYGDVVTGIRSQQYLTDAAAATALLTKMKYFVIVYDLFCNHFDAVVGAVMAVEGPGKTEDAMWATVLDMQNVADQCNNTILESRKLQARRRSSVVALTSRRSAVSLKNVQ